MKHECVGECGKNKDCPLCLHNIPEGEFCEFCDKIIRKSLAVNGRKAWDILSKDEKATKVKRAGLVSWYKKTVEEQKEQIAKLQKGREKSRLINLKNKN